MYIPTFGLIPNSSYLPPHVLDASGYVLVDEYLKLKGTDNVWAIGDVTDVEPSQFIYCDRQSCYLIKSIVSTLSNKKQLPYNPAAKRIMAFRSIELNLQLTLTGFLGIQVGRNVGTGHFGNFKLPSFMITFARKSLFVEFLSPLVSGSLFSGISSFTLFSTLDPS
jgi:apoptosis-inducing factor 2